MNSEAPKQSQEAQKSASEIRTELVKNVEAARQDNTIDQQEKIAIEERLVSLFREMGIPEGDIPNLTPIALEAAAKNKEADETDGLEKFLTELEAKYTSKEGSSSSTETPLVVRGFGPLVNKIQTTPAKELTVDQFLTDLSKEPLILAAYNDNSVRTTKMNEIKTRLQEKKNPEDLKAEMLNILNNLATDNKATVEKLKPYESVNKTEQIGNSFVQLLEKFGASSGMIASIIKMIADGLKDTFPSLDTSFLDDMRWPHLAKEYRTNVIPKVLGQNGESFELSDDEIIKLGKSYESIPGAYKPKDKTEYVTNEKKPKEFAAYLGNIRQQHIDQNGGKAPEKWTYDILANVEKGYRPKVMPPDGADTDKPGQPLDKYIENTPLAALIKQSHEFGTSVRGVISKFIEKFADQDQNKLNAIDGGSKEFSIGFQKIILEKKLKISDSNVTIKTTAADTIEIEQADSKKITVKKLAEGDKWSVKQEEKGESTFETDAKLIEEIGKLVKPSSAVESGDPATEARETESTTDVDAVTPLYINKDATLETLFLFANDGNDAEKRAFLETQLKKEQPDASDEDITEKMKQVNLDAADELASKGLVDKLGMQNNQSLDFEHSEPNKIIIKMQQSENGTIYEVEYSVEKNDDDSWKIMSTNPDYKYTEDNISESRMNQFGNIISRAFDNYIDGKEQAKKEKDSSETPDASGF